MRRATIVIVLLCVAIMSWGCQEATPEEKVAQTRARYSATLNGFFARDVPVESEEAGEPTEGEEPAEDAEPGDQPADPADPSEEEMVAPQTSQEITLDIIVQHDAAEALPGITVDITLVDSERAPKGSWRLWVETEGLPKANQKQITHVLQDVGFVDGDGWNVEIRRPIPPEEYGDYREFSGAGSG